MGRVGDGGRLGREVGWVRVGGNRWAGLLVGAGGRLGQEAGWVRVGGNRWVGLEGGGCEVGRKGIHASVVSRA